MPTAVPPPSPRTPKKSNQLRRESAAPYPLKSPRAAGLTSSNTRVILSTPSAKSPVLTSSNNRSFPEYPIPNYPHVEAFERQFARTDPSNAPSPSHPTYAGNVNGPFLHGAGASHHYPSSSVSSPSDVTSVTNYSTPSPPPSRKVSEARYRSNASATSAGHSHDLDTGNTSGSGRTPSTGRPSFNKPKEWFAQESEESASGTDRDADGETDPDC
ncbi:hypothetical protein SISSUDRAFT_1119356 [Sistotremastrum suecicum HHB10207 ss-3]|uniref:Uncharacterized protein n=1 Tax=Sistotremastrum suecicum HHB10207 ss-3 TaxID=1314776 RepID=A0A166DRK2_9AGAM|nr:hypothetical protein SISSUDRAFT_1119356 [Sistotremastrum suecicum HHB10207 ss-3]